jgi:hypothetical protein
MTNVPMDLLKLSAKKQPKPGELNANLQTQGSLAKMRYETGAGVPNAHDDRSDVFNKMRQQLGSGPKRGWRAGIAGLLDGLAVGSKSKGNDERREMARKMMDTFSSLEGIANEAGRRNALYAKKAALQEQLTPALEALTRNMSVLAYDDVVKVGSNIVERINQSSGTNYKISMIDQQNGKVLLTEAGKPDQKIDLFEMFPKIADEQNVEYLTKKAMQIQAEQDRRAEAQLGINQQNADAIQNRTQFSQDPDKQHDVTLGKEQAKALAKKQSTLSEQNLSLEDVSYKIQDLKDILNNSEMITGDTLSAGFERIIGKQLGNKAYSDTELYDSISKGLLSFVKGNLAFGNMNQKEFEFLTAQTPDSHKTKAALERMLNRFETTLDRQIKRNDREINAVPSYGRRNQLANEAQQKEQQEQMPAQTQLPPEQTQMSPQPQTEMVRMTAPDGTVVLIPAANVDLAMSQGARLVE